MADSLEASEIQRKIDELGGWFHNILLCGVPTAPQHFLGDYPNVVWTSFERSIPADLKGLSVLDIGCNAGFYSVEMKRRGASRVLGIDHDERYLAQARLAAKVLHADVEFRQLSIYQLAELREQFDLVICMGVFYHLRHPLLALDLIRQTVAKDWFIFQSMLRGSRTKPQVQPDYPFTESALFDQPGFPRMHFIEHSYCTDPTNWWIPNLACAEALLRSSGFSIVEAPEPEIFICRCRPDFAPHEIPEKLL